MTLFQAFILGVVQGATEFLPISSSGHLVLVPSFLGWSIPPKEAFLFDVLVQLGTLLAVIVYFWTDLVTIARATIDGILHGRPFEAPHARMGWYLLLSMLPAVVVGFILKDFIEATFSSVAVTAWFLLGTATLLLIGELAGKRARQMESLTWFDSLWIGAFQALALFPGVSRSGASIAGGMTRDLQRPDAARFAFLMAVPVMIAAGVLAIYDMLTTPDLTAFVPPLLVGFVVSAIVGYLAIHWLLSFLRTRPLYYFSVYCALVGILTLTLS